MSLDDYRVPRSELLLIDAARKFEGRTVLCTSLGRAQLAASIATERPDAAVTCAFLDCYAADETRDALANGFRNVTVVCAADPPAMQADLVCIPVTRGGEAELTRDLLQAGRLSVVDGGTLLAATDNARDTWLFDEMQKICSSVSRRVKPRGVVYRGRCDGPLKRIRDFRSEFAFRDGDRLVKAVSRPGVFSHRKLDLGARALLESMTVAPGEKILDMGCGCGPVGLAAALRAEGVTVHGVDSNARAVECLLAGAALNGLTSVTAQLDARGRCDGPGTFDLVVGNPPYYSHYAIAEIFLQAARRALKPGGRIHMVTKHAEWFNARMGQLFCDVSEEDVRGYVVVSARQP